MQVLPLYCSDSTDKMERMTRHRRPDRSYMLDPDLRPFSRLYIYPKRPTDGQADPRVTVRDARHRHRHATQSGFLVISTPKEPPQDKDRVVDCYHPGKRITAFIPSQTSGRSKRICRRIHLTDWRLFGGSDLTTLRECRCQHDHSALPQPKRSPAPAACPAPKPYKIRRTPRERIKCCKFKSCVQPRVPLEESDSDIAMETPCQDPTGQTDTTSSSTPVPVKRQPRKCCPLMCRPRRRRSASTAVKPKVAESAECADPCPNINRLEGTIEELRHELVELKQSINPNEHLEFNLSKRLIHLEHILQSIKQDMSKCLMRKDTSTCTTETISEQFHSKTVYSQCETQPKAKAKPKAKPKPQPKAEAKAKAKPQPNQCPAQMPDHSKTNDYSQSDTPCAPLLCGPRHANGESQTSNTGLRREKPALRNNTDKASQATSPMDVTQGCPAAMSSLTSSTTASNTTCTTMSEKKKQMDASSICLLCDSAQAKLLNSQLFDAVLQVVGHRDPGEIALTILLQPSGTYHINVAVLRTGTSLGCLYASEAAVEEAKSEGLFEDFLSFFIVDARNTVEQKNKILGYTFEFIKK